MRSRLCLVLIAVLAVGVLLPAAGAFALNPDFSIVVYDNSGVNSASIDGVLGEVTGHKMYAHIRNLSPYGRAYTSKWSSSRPSVVSVNSKGVITCKKEGLASISIKITDKKTGGWRRKTYNVVVLRNANEFSAMPGSFIESGKALKGAVASPLDIYIKGGNIYARMFIFNGGTKPLKKSAYFDIAYWPEFGDGIRLKDAINLGVRKVSLAGTIQPGMVGKSKPFKIGKPGGFLAKRDYLLDAFFMGTGASAPGKGDAQRQVLMRKLGPNAKAALAGARETTALG